MISRIVTLGGFLAVALLALTPLNNALAINDVNDVTAALDGGDNDPRVSGIDYMPIYDPVGQAIGSATGVSTADAGQLIYGGGAVETSEKEYFCYWGWTSDPSGEAAYLEAFTSNLGGSAWAAVQNQYYGSNGQITNPTGILKGTWSDPSSVPSRPSQTAVNNEGLRCEQHFGYDANANYWVLTPSGHSQSGFGTRWCAYHEGLSSSSGNVAVTYFPYITDAGASCGKNFVNGGSAGLLDGVSIVGGHEGREAQADPKPCTGWCNSGGSEGMDLCAWASNSGDISLGGRSYAVQPVYSNSAGGCVMS